MPDPRFLPQAYPGDRIVLACGRVQVGAVFPAAEGGQGEARWIFWLDASAPTHIQTARNTQAAQNALLAQFRSFLDAAGLTLRDEVEAARSEEYTRGYVVACGLLVALHDQPGMAADVIAQEGITWAQVKALDLSDYDMESLLQIRKERRSGLDDARRHRRDPVEAAE